MARTPFEGSTAGEITSFDIVRTNGSVSAEYDQGNASGKLLGHWHQGDHTFSDGWKSSDYTWGANGYFAYHFVGLGTASIGLDMKHYGGEATNTISGLDYGSPSVTEFAPSLGLQIPLGDRAVVTAAGLAQWHDKYGWFFAPEAGLALPRESDADTPRRRLPWLPQPGPSCALSVPTGSRGVEDVCGA